MSAAGLKTISNVIEQIAQPLSGESHDYDSLIAFAGAARLCLLGEATHGTQEFYRERAEITKRLIKERGFTGSYENLFHDLSPRNFLLTLRTGLAASALREQRLERAIGVIYLPQTERQSHYFEARLADQFDAVIHFDETRALEPLERYALWDTGEPPETFPTGV